MKFILADKSHDAQLREILCASTMPGHIQITYEREPDFFQGLETQGSFNQVIAAEEDGKILGFGCRSIRPMFINGEAVDFGYISGLRSSPEAKQKMGVPRGYREFRKQHADGRCPGYITTIIDGNDAAVATLTQGRAGLPFYNDLGTCFTYAIALKKRCQHPPHTNITTRFAKPGEDSIVINLLNGFGRQYQFFPALTETDFGTPLLRDLPVTQFLIAEQSGIPCGTAAVWDTAKFKQHRIKKYSPLLQLAKPVLNNGLKLAGYAPLPKPGDQINSAYLCFKAAKNNRADILQTLLHDACRHLCQTGYSHCITGFHCTDPAASILSTYPTTLYRSRLFFVGWKDDLAAFGNLDGRIPCFEPAIL